jgi:hypothetical protein
MPRNRSAMILVTQSELLELVEELRGMAAAAPTAKVRDALTRVADRYAAKGCRRQPPIPHLRISYREAVCPPFPRGVGAAGHSSTASACWIGLLWAYVASCSTVDSGIT